MPKPHTNTYITDELDKKFGFQCFTCGADDDSFPDLAAADAAALEHQCGSGWVTIGCDERDDVVKKAGESLVVVGSSEVSVTLGLPDSGHPVIRDHMSWDGDAPLHCSHERFIPSAVEDDYPMGGTPEQRMHWRDGTGANIQSATGLPSNAAASQVAEQMGDGS